MLTVLHQADQLLRKMLPLLVTLAFLLFSLALTRLMPGLAGIPPLLVTIAVYYWSVHRPDLLPLPVLFLIGLVTDALLRLPFGVTALNYIVMAQLVQGQRPVFADQSYTTLWLGFAVFLTVAQGLQWSLLSLCARQMLPATPLALQALLTLGLFPLIVWLLVRLHRSIVH